jgi:tagatose 1,6-diphosphate aldolase
MAATTPGKIAGLKAVSDERGVIAAAAMDQRGLLKTMLARELKTEEPPEAMVVEFKQIVTSVLTKYASSILLDLQYGLPATEFRRGKGLLLAYEKAGYSVDHPERLPTASEGWSVLRVKEAGADAIKILVYYTPFEDAWVNEQKHAWVERIGAECKAHDIPLFLEFVGYDVHGEDEKGIAYAKRKPEIVLRSMEEFSKERYLADVLKVEAPVQIQYIEGTKACKGPSAYTRAEAKEIFRKAQAATRLPFVYLSAGVSNDAFVEMLEFAVDCGISFNGVLCGRATWQDGVPAYVKDGARGLEQWLETQGAENIQKVNHVLKSAVPWNQR